MNLGAPSLARLCFCAKGGKPRLSTGRYQLSKNLGAPGLDFQTWESTNPNPHALNHPPQANDPGIQNFNGNRLLGRKNQRPRSCRPRRNRLSRGSSCVGMAKWLRIGYAQILSRITPGTKDFPCGLYGAHSPPKSRYRSSTSCCVITPSSSRRLARFTTGTSGQRST